MPLRKAGTPVVEPIENINAPAVVPAPVAETPFVAETLNSAWEAQQRRNLRSYMFQAALQSPALMQYAPSLEGYIELVCRTANAGVAYVNE